ncbi:hypothetical protein FCV44_07635 [Vibrio kanaloae]|uniref:hypothetical protein n=1 Tax=Vibrio kanaloae TaxID=170673 RepID=UPI000C8160ED|nr:MULTISPECIES: hypothetical protein [Vibrio]PMH22291.1 hypothetical protein BCU73_13705 [Vibrio cyclitrophicus]TKE98422.1 hypothetical protein FCV44_07635 [Vibrio kanaloae]TKF19810.1 hypothetical protein FCV47_02295 [Vibrio kanaloae]
MSNKENQKTELFSKKKLVVEFLNLDKKNHQHALFNGKNYFTDASYCYDKSSLHVRNQDLFLAICEYDIADLAEHFSSIYVSTTTHDGISLGFEVNTLRQVTRVSMVISFEFEDWKQPWSISEYFLEYKKEVSNYADYEVSCEVIDFYEDTHEPYYDLYNGIGIAKVLNDPKINLNVLHQEMLADSLAIDAVAVNLLARSDAIERCIEFPPQYHQAGIGILSYFSSYLSQQYPNSSARVKIEQNGTSVRMVIEAEDGSLETVEKALHEYEMIVTGKQNPEDFISDKLALFELKNELRIAQVRIETLQDLSGLQNSRIDKLMDIISLGLSREQNVVIDFRPEISVTNSVTFNQDISDIISSICELKAEMSSHNQSEDYLSSIEEALLELETETDPVVVKRSPVMPKLKRFLQQASDKDSELNTSINCIKSGVSMCQELFGKYNKLAEWCGLPVIPSIFVK